MTKRLEKPFLFTSWFAKIADCTEWFEWFRDRGIPAGIVSRQDSPCYSVWRTGIDMVGDGKVLGNRHFRVEAHCNGFDKDFNELYPKGGENAGTR